MNPINSIVLTLVRRRFFLGAALIDNLSYFAPAIASLYGVHIWGPASPKGLLLTAGVAVVLNILCAIKVFESWIDFQRQDE